MRGWIFWALAGLLFAGCTVMLPIVQMVVEGGHPDFEDYPHLHELDSLQVHQMVAVTDMGYHRHVGRYEGVGVYDPARYAKMYAQALEASPDSPWPKFQSMVQVQTASGSVIHGRFMGFDFETICVADSLSDEWIRIPMKRLTGLYAGPDQVINVDVVWKDLVYRRLPTWSYLTLKVKGKPVRISFYDIKNIEVPKGQKFPWSMFFLGLMVDVLICLISMVRVMQSAYASIGV